MSYYPVGMLNTVPKMSAGRMVPQDPRRAAATPLPLAVAEPHPPHYRPAAVPRRSSNTKKSAVELTVPAFAPATGPRGVRDEVARVERPQPPPPPHLVENVLDFPEPRPAERAILHAASSPDLGSARRKRVSEEDGAASKRPRSEPPSPQLPEEGEIVGNPSSQSFKIGCDPALKDIAKRLERSEHLEAENKELKLQLAEFAAAKAEISKLRAQTQNNEETERLARRLRGERNEARERHQTLLEEHNRFRVTNANRCDKLEGDLAKATKDAGFYKDRATDLDMQKAAVQATLEQESEARARLAQDLKAAKTSVVAYQSDIDRLNAEGKQAAGRLKRLDHALAASKAERDMDRARIANLEQELDRSERGRACALADLDASLSKLADLASKHKALEASMAEAIAVADAAAQTRVDTLKAEIAGKAGPFLEWLKTLDGH
ncbi:hypothetical protein DFJ74DRAFT_772846 [Hyaloraphidium curvatum]|nr:hypothetical protein DFJ74DRAFT_772846 [Hyaloraphidium curvatum]